MRATIGAVVASHSNDGDAFRARSTNSCTDSSARSASSGSSPAAGNSSDGTRQAISPGTPSGSRLVARTARSRHRDNTADTSGDDRVEEVLAVVDQEQELPPGELVDECGRRRPALGKRQTQRRRHRRSHEVGLVDPRQLDEPDAVGIPVGVESARCELQGEPGLARAAGPDQGQQPGAVEHGVQLPQLAASPDESGRECREIVGNRSVRRRAAREQSQVQLAGLAGRSDTVLFLQPVPQTLVGNDRVGAPSGIGQRGEECAVDLFIEWPLDRDRFRDDDGLVGVALRKECRHQSDDDGDTECRQVLAVWRGPVFVEVLGEELACPQLQRRRQVGGRVGATGVRRRVGEPVGVYDDITVGPEHHELVTKDEASGAEHAPRRVQRLMKVVRACREVAVWPEPVDQHVPVQMVARREGQELDERLGLPQTPRTVDQLAVEPRREAAQEADLDVAGPIHRERACPRDRHRAVGADRPHDRAYRSRFVHITDGRPVAGLRIRLLPWSRDEDWRRQTLPLVAALGAVRLALLAVSHTPFFYPDTATYLSVAQHLSIVRDRPVGVSVFYKLALQFHHSLTTLVVVQSLLGIGIGLLAYLVARELDIGHRLAVVAALVIGLAPSLLLFERVLLTETLSVFLFMFTLWLTVAATRLRSPALWALVGLTAAANVLVRSVMLFSLPVLLLVALFIIPGSFRRRFVAAAAFGLSALVVLAAYSAATYHQTESSTGRGHFGISFTDGFFLYAKYAELTDCSRPDDAPAIRGEICATPRFTERTLDGVLWDPGPVQRARYGRDYVARNSELRSLAFENIRNDPIGALGVVAGALPSFLEEEHWSSHLEPTTRESSSERDDSYLNRILTRDFGVDVAGWNADPLEDVWNTLYRVWGFIRVLAFLGWIGALVLVRRWWEHGGRGVLIVSAPALALVIATVSTAYPYPRYLLPIEGVAWVCTAWLVARLRDGDRVLGSEDQTSSHVAP